MNKELEQYIWQMADKTYHSPNYHKEEMYEGVGMFNITPAQQDGYIQGFKDADVANAMKYAVEFILKVYPIKPEDAVSFYNADHTRLSYEELYMQFIKSNQ